MHSNVVFSPEDYNLAWFYERVTKHPFRTVQTRQEIDEDLWCFLEYYSEVESIGLKFVKNRIKNHSIKSQIAFNAFQGYTRQAKSYYIAAKSLHYRSSSLLYYYCFLNLAKAYLVLEKPKIIINRNIQHGLSPRKTRYRTFEKQGILTKKGVFSHLYECEIGTSIPNDTFLNVLNLFSYCREISYEYTVGEFGDCKFVPCISIILGNESTNKSVIVIGLNKSNILNKYRTVQTNLGKYFIRLESMPKVAHHFFQNQSLNLSNFINYESKKSWSCNPEVPPLFEEMKEEIFKAFGSNFFENYFPNNFQFLISLPYFPNKQLPMNELLAIYSITFYLGNLTRYKPEYLEYLLNTEALWLIESFIRSCPLTFLQIIISRILKTDYIISRG